MGVLDFIFKSNKSVENVVKPKRFTSKVNYESELGRLTQDVGKWRKAVLEAEDQQEPFRANYYRLLKDVVLDSHLTAIINQRDNAVLRREVCFYNLDGTENEEVSKLFKRNWFAKLRQYILDSEKYGFTLIDLGDLTTDFQFPTITEVNRQFVRVEKGIVVADPYDLVGVDINDPAYAKWNIFIGEQLGLGYLSSAAPWVLWKKTIVAYWSEYCEKFGMPMRIGKTTMSDETMKANMENALRNMGGAFWAILEKDDEIEIKETFSTAAYDIYDKFIERANSEMSKLVLSQTGTTDEKSFAGSAGVHESVFDSMIESKINWHDNILNEIVLPKLLALGFPLQNGYFESEYEEQISLAQRVEMVAKFMPFVKFDKEYLQEEFDIIIESVNDSAPKTTTDQKTNVKNELRKYYDSL